MGLLQAIEAGALAYAGRLVRLGWEVAQIVGRLLSEFFGLGRSVAAELVGLAQSGWRAARAIADGGLIFPLPSAPRLPTLPRGTGLVETAIHFTDPRTGKVTARIVEFPVQGQMFWDDFLERAHGYLEDWAAKYETASPGLSGVEILAVYTGG